MAYANLVQINCADKKEAFCRMRDFICKRNGTYDYSATGIGWTLWDSSYAGTESTPAINDWFVIKSAGESTKEDLYFKFTWTSGYIQVFGYQAWDPTAHAGANQYNTTLTNFVVAEALVPQLWVYGNLDFIFVCTKASADTDVRYTLFGKTQKPWFYLNDQVAICSSALSLGNDVSITVDAVPAGWAVGRQIFIRTTHTNANTTVKIEKITIKTLNGLVITADLTNSYTANSRLTDHVGYWCSNSATVLGTGNTLIDPSGVVSSGSTVISFNSEVAGTNNDPGSYENRYGLAECGLSSTVGFFGKIPNTYRIALGSLALFDVLQEADLTQWRYIKCVTTLHHVFKEV